MNDKNILKKASKIKNILADIFYEIDGMHGEWEVSNPDKLESMITITLDLEGEMVQQAINVIALPDDRDILKRFIIDILSSMLRTAFINILSKMEMIEF